MLDDSTRYKAPGALGAISEQAVCARLSPADSRAQRAAAVRHAICSAAESGYGERSGKQMRNMVHGRAIAALVLLATCGSAAADGAASPPHATAWSCRNTTSGTTWQITIDFAESRVDSYPAQISSTEISWRDAKEGGTYTLDRQTGELTFVAPSSTGGYFLHHQCRVR